MTLDLSPLRAFSLALCAAALTACASAPASGVQRAAAPPAPFASAQGLGQGPRVIPGAPLQCVPYARQASGIQIFGDANTWWTQAAGRYPRSSSPAPGSVLVTRGYRDASRGHVAVVASVVNERLILVDHANWLNGGEVSVSVPVTDVSPQNDWSQVRVWHIPGQQWGARTYQAEGFIHPFLLAAIN